MKERGQGRGCLRCGCLGCLSLFVLAALVVAAIVVFALLTRPDPPAVEAVHRSRPVPVEAPAGSAGRPLAGAAGEPLDVRLDLSLGTFEVVPAPAGTAIRVEGEYDRSAYELVEQLEPLDNGHWSYRLSVRRRVALLSLLFHPEDSPVTITVHLPRGAPIHLEANVGAGDSRFELGGLDLRTARLSGGLGSMRVSFREPTARRMEWFRMSAGLGESAVFGLGFASPETVEVEGSIGELRIGLDGPWRGDSIVDARVGMGGLRIGHPEGVRVDLDDVRQTLGERNVDRLTADSDVGDDAPTLRLTLAQRIGEISVD